MGSGENRPAANFGEGDDQLAKDVARLYAWANVKGVPYRDFSLQRAVRHKQPVLPGEDQRVEIAPAPDKAANAAVSVPITHDIPAPVHASPVPTDTGSTHFADISQAAVSLPAPPTEAPMISPLIGARSRPRPRFIERLSLDAHKNRPALAVFSLAGGVGKTTISANLARILCVQGEEVLLVDASGSGLLPFYFGANDPRPGLRTFVAPGMKCFPLRVIGADDITQSWIDNDVSLAMAKSQRAIFDLGPATFSLLPQIFSICSEILIPLVPDLNSIFSISRIESSLERFRSAGAQIPSPYYVFNQFDDDYSLDHEVRELARRQCGDRLLPVTIRHGAEVAEAIGSRMTVADYAPASEVTRDFLGLALWLEKISPVHQKTAAVRWTEQ
jgi:cellulose biosynthesis protein BcsQ